MASAGSRSCSLQKRSTNSEGSGTGCSGHFVFGMVNEFGVKDSVHRLRLSEES